MSQTYLPIDVSKNVSILLKQLFSNDESLKSNFSGTSFPTSNLLVGMVCYRTDLKKLYRYTAENTWKIEIDFSANTAVVENALNDYLGNKIHEYYAEKKELLKIATTSEAETGTNDDKAMTPLKVKQSIIKNSPKMEIATTSEAETGTNDDKAMTPLKTKQSLSNVIGVGAIANNNINDGGLYIETTNTDVQENLWGKFKTKVGGVFKEIKIKSEQIVDFQSSVLSAIATRGLSSLGVVYSVGTNGYVCFGPLVGGLTIQWGTTVGNAYERVTVTYPIALRSIAVPIVVTFLPASSGYSPYMIDSTLENFTFHTRSNSYTPKISWISVGF